MAIATLIMGAIVGAWYVIGLYAVDRRADATIVPEDELPGHEHEKEHRVPPVLTIFYGFIVLSMIAYVLYVWLGGIRY